ncbi:hypothetical protein N7527_008438 [Penicillium freii]|nr:hypothetical protein N7527_008438 [Penicillium freii]
MQIVDSAASSQDGFSLAVHVAGSSLVALATGISCGSITRKALSICVTVARFPESKFYEDKDGEATQGSMRRLSDKWQRAGYAIFTFIGTIALIVRQSRPETANEVPRVEEWLQLSSWLMLLLQAGALVTEDRVTRRFTLGWRGSLCHVFMMVMLYSEYLSISRSMTPISVLHRALLITQFALGFLAFVFGLLLPRRPDVFRDGVVVDRQYTASFLTRISFGWVKEVISLTRTNRQIEFSDLPRLGSALRSSTLLDVFRSTQPLSLESSPPLWKRLFMAHRITLFLQLFLTVCSSLLSFAPQLALLGLLDTLEKNGLRTSLWLWIACLGVTTMMASVSESWTYFIAFNVIPNRVLGQMWAVVFDKTLRKKYIQEHKPVDDDEAEKKKSVNNNIVSLTTIDVQRVADCMAMFFSVFEAPIKFTISAVLLARLLGWQSLLLGLLSLAIIFPVQFLIVKRYRNTQASLMQSRDMRMDALFEALSGIRQIKVSASEHLWEDRINWLRDSEMAILSASWFWQMLLISYFYICPIVVSSVSMTAYLLLSENPSASVIFTSLSIFAAMEATMTIFPQTLINCLTSLLCLDRIGQYLDSPERDHVSLPADHISFEQVTISWTQGSLSDKPFTLKNINLSFPAGALSIISGSTGSGKSLLLSAILGECEVLSGVVRTPKSKTGAFPTHMNPGEPWILDSAIAFVPQTPWIENGTVRNNILFGLPFNDVRYRQVLDACALTKDLQTLVDGEFTEIGPKGVNLSGGQKWRITLARALYSRAGILVIDDIFSAVDAHTARQLCDQALTGPIASSRTRILATHHLHLCLSHAAYLVQLEHGHLRHAGSVEDHRQNGVLNLILHNMTGSASSYVTINEIEQNTEHGASHEGELEANASEGDSPRQPARVFVAEEEREQGSIKWATYKTYFQNIGGPHHFLAIMFVYAAYAFFTLGRNWWLGNQPGSAGDKPKEQKMTISSLDPQLLRFLLVYIGLCVMGCVVAVCSNYLVFSSVLRASKAFFRQFLQAVVRSPLRWLDTTPLGRILNRFSADINTLDTQLGYTMRNIIANLCDAITILVAGMVVNSQVLVLAIVLLPFCIQYARLYLNATREVKRLQSVALSPIIEQLGSVMDGLPIIRTFNVSHLYMDRMLEKIDSYTRANWHVWLLVRWLSFRMSTISALFTSLAAFIIISAPGMTAAKAGFAITFAMRLTRAILQITQGYGNFQMAMNSIERLTAYANMESEMYEGQTAPSSWPAQGHLKVSDLVVSYAPDLPPVLKGVSFEVAPRQRVGIVGRTGSGKSSLALSLFRFVEAQQGTISLDGTDISTIPLKQLRSRLSIIPQDPILFSGTLRSNLDPFEEHTDPELVSVLFRVHWMPKLLPEAQDPNTSDKPGNSSGFTLQVPSRPKSLLSGDAETLISDQQSISSVLDTFIAPGATNLSQGQRQKICLARAIISQPKLLILDEATSAIDKGTDSLIQDSIRSELARSSTTLLVIAHRISTVADFDRIIVMDQGQVVENGTPQELACNPGGYFRKLVEESTERTPLHDYIQA